MSLENYQKKRDFTKTKEPVGKAVFEYQNRFVVQKHQARTLHYDFRLEMSEESHGGEIVLKSWAIPKGMPEKFGIKRLAIVTEDHPVAYINFEGIIPEGSYGAGKVEIWDKGSYNLISREPRSLLFELKGKKLSGKYRLVLFKPPKNWLVFKVEEKMGKESI